MTQMHAAERAALFKSKVTEQVARRIVGQQEIVHHLLTSLVAGGHSLLIGLPGLAKTLMVHTLASACGLSFSRIQFTPDLMPSDILGTEVLVEDRQTSARSFQFQKGPVFASLVLADEINRTPPKTQAALLEAMQERRVTVAGVSHILPQPFHVLATQNPIEQEGTYPLPEAQLDRFLFSLEIGYPNEEEEINVLKQESGVVNEEITPVVTREELLRMQTESRQIVVSDSLYRAVVRMLRDSRPQTSSLAPVTEHVRYGAGPRAGTFLMTAAKARAYLEGRPHVTPADVSAVTAPVLRHRILLDYTADAAGVKVDHIIDLLLKNLSG